MILSGDQLLPYDFSKMVEEHLDRRADVTVSAKPVLISEASGLGLLRVGQDSKIGILLRSHRSEVLSDWYHPSESKWSRTGPLSDGNLCF